MSSTKASLFTGLPDRLATAGIEPLDGLYQFEVQDSEGSRWSVLCEGGRTEVSAGFADPACGHLSIRIETLASIWAGELDPIAAGGTPMLYYVYGSREPPGSVPVEESEEIRMQTLLFQCFNERHLTPRFRDHEVGRFYRTGTALDLAGQPVIVGAWSIPANLGQLLYDLVTAHGLSRTLEIGLAYGVSAMYVGEAHRDLGAGLHIAIDPWQTREFRDIGLENIRRCGVSDHFELLRTPDYEALPELQQRGDRFDLVFIDGLHIFDYALLDFFYADLLLRPGGFVVFDDSTFPGVAKVIAYVRTNRAYAVVPQASERITVLKKLDEDRRAELDVTFHEPF